MTSSWQRIKTEQEFSEITKNKNKQFLVVWSKPWSSACLCFQTALLNLLSNLTLSSLTVLFVDIYDLPKLWIDAKASCLPFCEFYHASYKMSSCCPCLSVDDEKQEQKEAEQEEEWVSWIYLNMLAVKQRTIVRQKNLFFIKEGKEEEEKKT